LNIPILRIGDAVLEPLVRVSEERLSREASSSTMELGEEIPDLSNYYI
jgi:hypothetical protein